MSNLPAPAELARMIVTDAYETESGIVFQAILPGDMPGDMPLAEGIACASAADAVDSLLSVLGIR